MLVELGATYDAYQDTAFRHLQCTKLQADEVWSFVGCKEKNATAQHKAKGWGDVWTWKCLDADSKLLVARYIGTRDAMAAYHFMHDITGQLAHRVQLITDGHSAYLSAVETAFESEIDYAQLQKIYGKDEESADTRYSPAACMGARKAVIKGAPAYEHVSTSHVERGNLSLRQGNKRFSRLTLGFSRKIENHAATVALHPMAYNFHKIHGTLRMTPAMAAGVTEHVWEISEIVDLLQWQQARKAA